MSTATATCRSTRGLWVPLPQGCDRARIAASLDAQASRCPDPDAQGALHHIAEQLHRHEETPHVEADELIADVLTDWGLIGVYDLAQEIATQLLEHGHLRRE